MAKENKSTPEVNEESTEPRTPFEEFLHHQRRALEETGKALEALLPEGFRTHSTNASKEFTQGFKVLVEGLMDELKQATKKKSASEEDDDSPPSTTGKTKVKVQVD